ncbi:hypothetical protein ECZU27_09910 [Escherichia coli]|nr:hypothetical protein ECZU27_09910 [Escherichia coli]
MWPDNRIAEDAHYVYRHDEYGRLTEKTDRIPAGVIRTDDERTHHYHYDSQHRPVFLQHGEPLVESRYLYDPLGRRMAKRVWRRERDLTGWMSLSRKPEVTWYGWDGDRLTTVQTDTTRIQTVYEPGLHAAHPGRDRERRAGKRSGAAGRDAPAGRVRTATAWCSRLNWCGCWTGWRKKSGQTA